MATPPGLPLPVSRSLLKTLRRLSQPMYRRTSFRPTEIVTALSSNRRITNREQQDAQEFFQLISSALDTEAQRVVQYTRFGGGFKELLSVDSQGQRGSSHAWLGRGLKGLVNPVIKRKEFENPLTGLLANRLSCLKCKYTGAIRHFSFNNIQLNLPNKYTATLEECLSRFTDIEYLQDASCRRCSFIATIETLEQEIARLKKNSKKTNKKKHLAPLQAKKSRMEHLLKMRRIDDDDEEGSKEECMRMSCLSSKQVMLAKPSKILCLHVSRSAYLSTGMVYKNQCRLLFPEYLDIGPYTTDGADINVEQPQESMSSPSDQSHDRRIYKLMSIVVHYGSHSYGHFVAYKRRIYTDRCECDQCGAEHKKEIYNGQDVWYRISDTKVDECTLEDVLHSNPYMLLYELDESMSSRDCCASASSRSSISSESSTHVPLFEEKSNDIYSPIDDAAKEALFVANALLRSAA
ncbi:cysteine proteinase [Rhizopus microsporus ATCC 52813]|uniref:ubiquitinyl hydrolase 1 n=2 Tax=Rhizopus microsporus TaxID=58291 RepID=A0A2G4SEL9_RHIZD|nr:cysteine proteinase [Rhizopus microsporus ATCC 52813]XP_023463102.1 cysteine proteinase [Rhizopus microsporus ATCC 52813]PHZ07232.1 cysteine proteinase [Rhizopus microsporus ATCC 52813]PHZ09394.1 cysteine proteinase [Rhizopus microsporus ATCC 52813]